MQQACGAAAVRICKVAGPLGGCESVSMDFCGARWAKVVECALGQARWAASRLLLTRWVRGTYRGPVGPCALLPLALLSAVGK